MTDEWGRANPELPDPHAHYPKHYSPAGFVHEIAAWHEEHDRWLKEQAAAPTAVVALADLRHVMDHVDPMPGIDFDAFNRLRRAAGLLEPSQ